jgi:hypothetical protein
MRIRPYFIENTLPIYSLVWSDPVLQENIIVLSIDNLPNG